MSGWPEVIQPGRLEWRRRIVGVADLSQKRIKRGPVLGGLINEYERAA
jgi:hypothetical protein